MWVYALVERSEREEIGFMHAWYFSKLVLGEGRGKKRVELRKWYEICTTGISFSWFGPRETNPEGQESAPVSKSRLFVCAPAQGGLTGTRYAQIKIPHYPNSSTAPKA